MDCGFERLSWMQRIAIMRKLKKTRNAFAFRSRTYCPKKSVRHCLATALRYAGQTTHIKHCRYICNIFFVTLRYRMQVRHWDGNQVLTWDASKTLLQHLSEPSLEAYLSKLNALVQDVAALQFAHFYVC